MILFQRFMAVHVAQQVFDGFAREDVTSLFTKTNEQRQIVVRSENKHE